MEGDQALAHGIADALDQAAGLPCQHQLCEFTLDRSVDAQSGRVLAQCSSKVS